MHKIILLTVLMLGSTLAPAADGLFYLGAGVTHSSLIANNNGYIAYGTPNLSNSWKAFAGVRPLSWFALEADYIDLGSGSTSTFSNESTDTTHADSSAWAAYAIGFLPVSLPVVEFYGKVGAVRWKLNSTLIQDYHNLFNTPPPPPLITPRNYSATDFAWGVGVQAHVKMFGVRLEYEGFNVDSNSANVASLSVLLNL